MVMMMMMMVVVVVVVVVKLYTPIRRPFCLG